MYSLFFINVRRARSFLEDRISIFLLYRGKTIQYILNRIFLLSFSRKDYVAFEQGINPIIAEKMTSERSRDYMNARRVAKEYEASTRGLNKSAPCIPPTGNVEEAKQVINPTTTQLNKKIPYI